MSRRDHEPHGGGHRESRHMEPWHLGTRHHRPRNEDHLGGGLYLDEAGEHPPDYSEPITYDEKRWGGPHRDATRGGMPTISVCRVAALRLLARREGSAADVLHEIVREFDLGPTAVDQHTRSGENRLEVRVHWALATLRQLGFIEQVEAGAPVPQHAPNSSKRAEALEIFTITAKGQAMLEKDPVRIDENGTGSIRKGAHGQHQGAQEASEDPEAP